MLKRIFDFILGIIASVFLVLPIIIIAVLVRITSPGPSLYWSPRIGRNNVVFNMPKFRTMQTGTPNVATYLLSDPQTHLTPIGSFLRQTSLDELPQLWSIIRGDMSFVGPRPVLSNEQNLINLRNEKKIYRLMPGLTGWAQINGRDELTDTEKAALDFEYMQRQSFWFDIRILWITPVKVLRGDGISH